MLTSLLHRIVSLRTSAHPLALARILMGVSAALASFEAWRSLPRLLAPLVVRIPFFPWLPVLPAGALRIFIGAWLVATLLFVLGWKTRLAGTVLTLVTAYALILDQQTYSNHLYLVVLILLLLTIAGSGAAWSLDARLGMERSEVAAWPILLLKIQITTVYFFSAMAKLTPSYLAGEIVTQNLKHEGWLTVPQSWRSPSAMSVLAVTSILAELFIAFGLWSPRLRRFAITAGVGFHLAILGVMDASRLSLAIFALSMFAVYPLFLKPPSAARFLTVHFPRG